MLSFHNDPLIKDKYLRRVIRHRELDNIIQGTGWSNGKGCAVGCTLEDYNHSRYPIELGIPEWLAHLEDTIFENLPNEEAKLWPELFLSSIPVGVDLRNLKHKLAIHRLDILLEIQNKILKLYENTDLEKIFIEVIQSIEEVIKCHESELNKTYCDWSAARSAAWSAGSEARSAECSDARSAAWSAADSAAESAAESDVRSAAWSAAWSAESAAWSAADSAACSDAKSAVRSSSWSAAWSAAWSAESAAGSSVRSAAWSAARSSAESAAWSAWSAARSAADSAADSAACSDAKSAVRSAAWKKESENLIELIKQCK